VLGRRGNGGRGSAGDRLTGGCGGGGEDCHAQGDETEELHFVGCEGVGGELWMGWSRRVETGEDECLGL